MKLPLLGGVVLGSEMSSFPVVCTNCFTLWGGVVSMLSQISSGMKGVAAIFSCSVSGSGVRFIGGESRSVWCLSLPSTITGQVSSFITFLGDLSLGSSGMLFGVEHIIVSDKEVV